MRNSEIKNQPPLFFSNSAIHILHSAILFHGQFKSKASLINSISSLPGVRRMAKVHGCPSFHFDEDQGVFLLGYEVHLTHLADIVLFNNAIASRWVRWT